MRGLPIRASISEMVSLGEGGKKTVGVKVFLAGGCREDVLVNKVEVGSVYCCGREAQERSLMICVRI